MGWKLGIFKTEGRESTETSQRSKASTRSGRSVRKQQEKPPAGTKADSGRLTWAPAAQPKPTHHTTVITSKRNHLFSACELPPMFSHILAIFDRYLFHSSCHTQILFCGSELQQLETPDLYTTYSKNYDSIYFCKHSKILDV